MVGHITEYKVMVEKLRTRPTKIDFSLEGNKEIMEENQEAQKFNSIQEEYHYWHLRLKHPSKARMEWMINSGWLPKHLKKVTSNPPLCSGCEIAKATKKPWKV